MSRNATGLIKGDFSRGVMRLASGSAAAHIISMACLPLVTRLYEPDAIGVQNLFLSAAILISILFGGGLHQAIPMARNDSEVSSLVKSTFWFGVALCFLFSVLAGAYGQQILVIIGLEELANFVVWIPLVALSMSMALVADGVCYRFSKFGGQAIASVSQASVNQTLKLVWGLFNNSSGVLIFSSSFAYLVKFGIAWWRGFEGRRGIVTPYYLTATDVSVLKRYQSFPRYRLPQMLLNSLSQHIPVFLLAAYYGSAESAYYGVAVAVVGVPVLLVGNSVGSVFYPKYARDFEEQPALAAKLLLKSTALLFAGCIVPFVLFAMTSEILFEVVFGPGWTLSSSYAAWMVFYGIFMFGSRPAVAAIPVLGLNRKFLVFEVFSSSLKVSAMVVAIYFFNESVTAVIFYSVVSALTYAALTAYVVIKACRSDMKPISSFWNR
jgi:O-antigen/teichoic acid export membrane protein